MRNLTRLGTVVESLSKLLRELAHQEPEQAAELEPDWYQRYVTRQGNANLSDPQPRKSKRRLPEARADLASLVHRFHATDAAELASFKFLERVFSEQFEDFSD
jgi:hypothetical protein